MTTPDGETTFEKVLSILEEERKQSLAKQPSGNGILYDRHLNVQLTFGETPITFALQDMDLEAVTIPTRKGLRMFTKKVKTRGLHNEQRIEYPAITIYERDEMKDWPNFEESVQMLVRDYGSLIVPPTIDTLDQATA